MSKVKKVFPMSEYDFNLFIADAECKASHAVLDGVRVRLHLRYNTYYRESRSLNLSDYQLGWYYIHDYLKPSDIDIRYFSLPI